MASESILLEKWYLGADGCITAWVPHILHTSKLYAALRTSPLKDCYTGKTHGSHVYETTIDGLSAVNGITVEYEYSIPLTNLKQRKLKWQWQGLYKNMVIDFNLEQHIQETNGHHDQNQTLKEITDIIAKLNEPPKVKYQLHHFRVSEGLVLCQHCGEFLADLKKEKKTDVLPGCLAYNPNI